VVTHHSLRQIIIEGRFTSVKLRQSSVVDPQPTQAQTLVCHGPMRVRSNSSQTFAKTAHLKCLIEVEAAGIDPKALSANTTQKCLASTNLTRPGLLIVARHKKSSMNKWVRVYAVVDAAEENHGRVWNGGWIFLVSGTS
jgi:hypothetical protein